MGRTRGGGGGVGTRKHGNSYSEGPRRASITLREEATGKLKTKESTSIKSLLKVDHLKKLAVWATHEAQVPSLGAFYGHHLAAVAEAAGVPPDPSLITCQRCETVLHPGVNTTVRIEKNRSKARHRSNKPVNKTQNNVVYKCHFCLHLNVKRGTPKEYAPLKGKGPSRNKSSLESKAPIESIKQESSKSEKGIICEDKANQVDVFASHVAPNDLSLFEGPATPSSVSITATTLEGNKRRRDSSTSKKGHETASMSAKSDACKTQSTASKRRKRSWTSLKDLAQRNEQDNSHVANLTIPFLLK